MKTILFVDDNIVSLSAAKTVLNEHYRVITVTHGSQALTFLEKNTCDLILLDINMPEMDGKNVLLGGCYISDIAAYKYTNNKLSGGTL